jgi:serine/threonine-protein kinase
MSGIPAGAGSLLGKRLGKYEILALLALGGTAEIYLARIGGAAGFEKYVVVKCLHDHLADDTEFVKMFLDEARLGAMFDHSNVVQTFELGEHENRYYMAMEFLAGLSLAMVVRRAVDRLPGGLMPVPLIFNIAAQSCAGLHYAHERTANGKPLNLVHRDISPQNLVISFEGIVKVVDFGIARAELRDTKTKAGTIKGKFAYMSPEQCVAANVDRRTDIFALGVIVWELLVGKRLFKRTSPYETYQAVIECAVPVPSSINAQLDPQVDQIVMKAVAKDKEDRYPTAEAFGDALLGYLHHRGKSSGPSEISRFFDQHFTQEIEEHGERMRELIAGRADSLDLSWGVEEDEKKANETVDLGANDIESVDSLDVVEVQTGDASLDALVDDLPGGEDEGNQPADRTRIEANPMELLEQLNNQGKTPVPVGTASGADPLPAPPSVPQKPVAAPVQQPGKFPALANLPTQIAENTPPPQPKAAVETAPTAMAAPTVNPNLNQTMADLPQAPVVAHGPPMGQPFVPPVGPQSSTQYAVRASAMQQAQQPPMQQPPMQQPLNKALPTDYPVMTGGRPFSSDLAPSDLHRRAPHTPAGGNAQQAMNMMSPVGPQFPTTDWEAAAAQPATALPRWKLALLFIAVVGN